MMSGYLTVGTILNNRYEIIEMLGQGGMAHVYKAHCHVLNRNVAIKVLRDEFVKDETFIRRFTTEAQAAAALSHANIVSIFDVASEGDLHYIVMELIEGITLKEYIEANKPLDWQTATNFEQQICAALDCAHRNNVIHQDIKPQNILITPEGVLKVTDFGIAHAANSSTIIAGDADGAVGSVHYCSPEQARGGYTDAKTDIYSAGVVLYEMLTGSVPFDATTPVAVAMKHIEEEVPSPRVLNPDIPEDLEKVIFKSMNREKRCRYASAADMFRDLSYVFEGITVSPTVEGGDEESHTSPRRKRSTEKDKKEGIKRRNDIFIILGSVLAAGIILMLVVFGLLSTGGQKNEVMVPYIVNMTQEEASKVLADNKLELRVDEIVPSTDVPAGSVIEQEPVSGRSVKKGSVVVVRISAGADLRVPNVVGYDLEQAVKELEDRGFKVLIRNRQEEGADADEVVGQSPTANSAASRGDSVTIYVNTKGEDVIVPRLIGMTKGEAERVLREEGLKLGTVKEKNSSEPKGKIIEQTPEQGATVQPDTAVDIVISNGKSEESTTPDDPVDQLKEKSISIAVPTDKETTQIRVEQNGVAVHDAQHAKSEGVFTLRLRGKGTVKIEIFHNGVSKGVRNITF